MTHDDAAKRALAEIAQSPRRQADFADRSATAHDG
jgi:hypothetical protein